jgi:hypothetical protein
MPGTVRCATLARMGSVGSKLSAWVRERPTRRAKRAAWDRYRNAMEALDDARRAFKSDPNYVTAEQVHGAEVDYADAIAIAGEFEVMDLSWEIAWAWED